MRVPRESLESLVSMLKSALCAWSITNQSGQDDNLETMVVGLLDIPPEVWLSHYPFMEDDVEQASLARYMVFVPVLYSTIWVGSTLKFQDAWMGRLRAFKLIWTLNE